MTGDSLGEVIRRIGRSVGLQGDLALTDAQLLERFVARRDEPAFAALVARHGPMVLGVCRRLVRDAQEAEDAFQATFLVLARKAAAIQRQPLLAGWLYGVAYRVAVRLRGQTARRRTREQQDVDLTELAAAADGADSDVRPLVHEEVGRLPDKYRSAVVLCYLEGKTNEEAALQLRWPVGSVKSRLARARELLRTRLTRRGLALSAGLLTTELVLNKTSASPALVDATIRGAALFAGGDTVAGGLISARAVKLSYGVLRTMILTKAKILTALVLTVAMLGGAAGLAYRSLAAGTDDTPKAASAKTASHDDRPKTDKEKPNEGESKTDAEAIQGVWLVTAVETEGKERDDEGATQLKKRKWTITKDEIVIGFNLPGEGNNTVGCSYEMDSTKAPKTLNITLLYEAEETHPLGERKMRTIYSLEGDVLKICKGLTADEIKYNGQDVGRRPRPFDPRDLMADGERPTELVTKEGSRSTLLTLKRETADKDKPKEEKPKASESKKDAEAIQGVWHVTGLETEGKERDDAGAKLIKTQEWTIAKDRIVIKTAVPGTGDHKVSCSYMIDPTKTPMTIDVTMEYGDDTVKAERKVRAIYSLKGDVLKVCKGMLAAEIKHDDQDVGRRPRPFDPRDLTTDGGRPTELATKEGSRSTLITLKRELADKDKPKDECAWGKAVKGFQAGLCIRPAEKDSYAIGETAMFVVKVRNGSDKPVEFRYVAPIPIGNDVDQLVSPSVLDADNNRVNLSGPIFSGGGGQGYGKKTLGADEEIEFALPTLVVAPESEPRVTEKPMAHVKPGKYKVYYNVYYVNPDDTGNYLSTGQVEITVRAKK